MRAELLRLAGEMASRGEPFVLAVVVRREPASSAQAGDAALVSADGEFHGWLGGSCTQPTVIREALAALAEGRPRLVSLAPDPEVERRPGVAVFPMTCHSGGTVEIYLEPVLPAPRLVIFGVSPVARALCRLGAAMGYRVEVADPAAEAELFPEAAVVTTSLDELPTGVAPAVVVATMGQLDEEATRRGMALGPFYLGVVASRRRFAQMRQTLAAGGAGDDELDAISSPAGLDIGARRPEEIAVSVLAEIVERRSAATAGDGGADGEPGDHADAEVAIDPVCGMEVKVGAAAASAVVDGEAYYFCCGGCRERFVADPAGFLGGAEETA